MNKQLIIIFVFFAFLSEAFAQLFPNYQERSFKSLTDSISFSSLQASEGILDENEYYVGPGDKIFIAISGIEETQLTLIINHEGQLYIPRVGSVDLKNKTLTRSKALILNEINKNFKDVDIFISLLDFRRIKVSIVGDVTKPSTYVLSANSRLLDLLKSGEGLNRSADIRNILIKSKDGSEKKVDFLSFLRLGDYSQNPMLREGDVIIVNKVDKVVWISGEVKYPAVYEFREGEDILQLIKIAGGYLFTARKDSIELIRFDEEGIAQTSYYYSVNELNNNQIKLRNKDYVIIRPIPEYFKDQFVKIEGKIKYPGYYKIVKNKTLLSEIINEAGGFLEDASLSDASLTRLDADSTYDPEFERLKIIPRADMTDDEYDYLKAKSRQRKGRVVVDFDQLFIKGNAQEDLILRNGDIIRIPEQKNYVILLGQVVNPGNIVYNPNLKVDDYIRLAGGFGWRALEGDVRVIKANTGEWIDADDVEMLDPGDTIWIPEDPPGPKFWDVFTTSLQVLGQLAAIVAATVAVIIATR